MPTVSNAKYLLGDRAWNDNAIFFKTEFVGVSKCVTNVCIMVLSFLYVQALNEKEMTSAVDGEATWHSRVGPRPMAFRHDLAIVLAFLHT
jgi:hypothetical protein